MFTPDSRYASQPVLDHVRADGVRVRYVLPRILPAPEDFAVALHHRVADSERIDSLAHRHLGVPTAWWVIADANRAVHPAALPGPPGADLLIPVPGTVRPRG